MTDDERKQPAGEHDPADPITPGFSALGGITGGSVPPAEPISNAANPFAADESASGAPPEGPAGAFGERAWLWALGGLVLFAIVAVTIWLATRGDEDREGAGMARDAVVAVSVAEVAAADH